MKRGYDFSNGVRGKFHNPDGKLNFPIYLEPEIADFVEKLAFEKNIDRIVSGLRKKDREIIELG